MLNYFAQVTILTDQPPSDETVCVSSKNQMEGLFNLQSAGKIKVTSVLRQPDMLTYQELIERISR